MYDKLCSYSPNANHDALSTYLDELHQDKAAWSHFILDFRLQLDVPRRREAYLTAVVMGLAYLVGGLLPMIPYFVIKHTTTALFISIGITAVILIVFGFLKAKYVGCTARDSAWSAVLTLGVGAAAASVSYGMVKGVQGSQVI